MSINNVNNAYTFEDAYIDTISSMNEHGTIIK